MAYSSIAVANHFIKKSFESGTRLTPMQLVKLVYIAHGWYLARTGEPLLSDAVEAWKYGPVIPKLYHQFKQYRDSPITSMAMVMGEGQFFAPEITDPSVAAFLDSVWDVYKNFDGIQLSTLTHQDGTPWFQVWRDQKGFETRGAVIPNQLIKNHYEQLARERAA